MVVANRRYLSMDKNTKQNQNNNNDQVQLNEVKTKNKKKAIFLQTKGIIAIVVIVAILVVATMILLPKMFSQNSKLNLVNGEISIYHDNEPHKDYLVLGVQYKTNIQFELENLTDEIKTVQLVIHINNIRVNEYAEFKGVLFSSFESDGSGENTTVVLNYDLEPNSLSQNEIEFSFIPIALSENLKISISMDDQKNILVYQSKIEMGMN